MQRSLYFIAICVWSCQDAPPPRTSGVPRDVGEALYELWEVEETLRATTDFATLPPSDERMGSDPGELVPLSEQRVAGLLRGVDALVILDGDGREHSRVLVPAPSALALDGDTLWVASELDGELRRFAVRATGLRPLSAVKTPATGVRDLTVRAGRWLVASEFDGALFSEEARIDCPGAIQVETVGDSVVANCLLGPYLLVQRARMTPVRIAHDGPFWRFAVGPDSHTLFATGVEDHPLDRKDGGFGYVDSFLYVYDLKSLTRLQAKNLGEHGAIVPKALYVGADATVTLFSYGSDRGVTVRGDAIDGFQVPPGTASAVPMANGWLLANALFDTWVVGQPGNWQQRTVPSRTPRNAASRLGEALFFTNLMAPWSTATGKRSRFSCETCHFEGYGDGRRHYTGRDDVYATTRPLLGLVNNRPHFSRALDPTTTDMVHNEFAVANRHHHDPWFALTSADAPWLSDLGFSTLSPLELRRAFFTFLLEFSHRKSPGGSAPLSEMERHGADLFATRCEGCHQARLVTDRAETRVPRDRWEALIRTPANPLVWASDAYAWTGVVPSVHELGARIPSLRRLYKKRPYFTNGGAADLRTVLARFGWTDRSYHDQAPADARRLSAEDKRALLAFLRRL